MMGPRILRLWWLGIIVWVLTRALPAAEHPVDFNREIRPILSDKCFACHGPDDKQRKAKLRLDIRDVALHPAKSGAIAIVPRNPAESELVRRITTRDADDLMPPPESGKSLTPAQVALMTRWVEEGAEYREHWAFVPPQRPPVPNDPATNVEVRNPIDAFVRARLREEGLGPAPEADRATLIRRASLDITGLPPTPDEVDAFLADTTPKAYEKLVDRLLDDPRYGERMALDWLDASRYADTHGYHLDSARDMTSWRDWVIRSYNENKPFDAFTIEQLAGDLLPEATREQKVASGFNRNHMINYEGGAIPEEYHYAYLVDRVNTTATVWLGLTMACAQCHDHKFDPLTRVDFYRFFAFFNNVPEKGLDGNRGNAAPVLKLPTPEQATRLAELNQAVEKAEQVLGGPIPEIDAAQSAWELDLIASPPTTWTVVDPDQSAATSGAEFRQLPDRSLLVSGPNPDRDTYTFALTNPLPALTALRIEALPDPSLADRGPGRAENGNFLLTGAHLSVDQAVVPWRSASADFSQKDHAVTAVLDERSDTGWAIDGALGKAHTAILETGSPWPAGPLTLRLEFLGNYPRHAIGRLRLAVTSSARPHEPPVPDEIQTLVAKPVAERAAEEQQQVRKFYRDRISPEFKRLKDQHVALRSERDQLDAQIPTTMVMAELDTPRETFMRVRGQYDQLGDKVTAATPVFLPPLPEGQPLNRLGLARWLVSASNPLTARVMANRYWQIYFGTGLVKTAEDFGSQGEWPSNPLLLDWLAREFIETGWNVKHIQRLILTSATYRQSSRVSTDQFERDPENRWLARGPRFRLPAEFIRDQALAISGLLNRQIGGKSVSPYQPAGLWEELSMREDSKNFSAQFFVQSQGADLYRRSMYTFWKRSSPPPQMSTFDAPDRETCTVRRPRTNTPLQALILLNDPTYLEASRKLAEQLLARSGGDEDRIDWAFRLATARLPNSSERNVLLRVLNQQRAHYRAHRDAAEQLLSTGDASRDLTLDSAELAAWTMLSSTLLNLDETVTKG